MKSKYSNLIQGITGLVLCALLFSFAPVNPGGESYTLFLNDRLIIEHYFTSKAELPGFSLAKANASDKLSVYYNECGKIGTARRLSVRDENGNVLKEWRFDDTTREHTPLTCKAGDIQKLAQPGTNKLKLYYTSREVTEARALATIAVATENKSVSSKLLR
jgi:hypothetical protein